ncbi:MAG: helix-turn-helix transcriptional regulator [Dongiaceae bacterium]
MTEPVDKEPESGTLTERNEFERGEHAAASAIDMVRALSARAGPRLGDEAWYKALGETVRAIGGDEFQPRLLRLFAAIIPNDMSMVVRYSRFSAPDYLVHVGISHHLIELYRASYYRFDPFYSYWQKRERGGVASLREVASPDLLRSAYRRVFQRQAHISDELGMFLPGLGRSSIALFLERSKGWFTPAEKRRAQLIYPLIAALYRAHVGRIFAILDRNAAAAGTGERATLLVDRAGGRVHANKAWRDGEAKDREVARALAKLSERAPGQIEMTGGRVMHVERLDSDFPLAPDGRIYVIELAGLPPERLRPREVLSRHGTGLTPRERDIVQLILEGYPTATIATRLGIGRGTIKNHRKRIYDKLDITSERELFLLYLQWLSGPPVDKPATANPANDPHRSGRQSR